MTQILTVLDDIVKGIDYLLSRTEVLDGPLGNALRLDLHSARQHSVNIGEQQTGTAASADDVDQGTAASGALGAANIGGTGSGPQPTVEPAPPQAPPAGSLTDATHAPATIPQAAWDALPPDARAAILADAGKGSPLGAQPAPEDQAGAEQAAPPWVPSDGSQAAS